MNFKGFYDEIIFDADRSILKRYTGKQGDTKSRGLYVTVTQRNVVIKDLAGLRMRMFYEKPDKTRGFIDGVIDGSKFRIDYTNQMYAVPGVVKAELRLMGADGEIITDRTFRILVDSSIADGSIISKDERGILDRAFELAEDIIPRLELLDVELLEEVQAEMLGARHSEPRNITYDSLGQRLDAAEQDLFVLHAGYADLKGYIGYTDDIYGLEADFVNNRFTRITDAVGKEPGADFDNINAFGGRKRCIITDDGVVLAYYGEPVYTETGALTQAVTKGETTYPAGTHVQVMVEQPKFYYRVVPLELEKIQDGVGFHLRKARYYVSDVPKAGYKVHPAFVRNGVEVDNIYLSAYEGSIYDESARTYLLADEQIANFNEDKLSSIANAKPASGLTQHLTRANTRRLANNRGTGWQQQDVLCASASQMLMMIEYAAFNMQSAIGLGVVSKTDDGSTNMSELTGATSTLGNASGMAAGTNGLVSISYRGEENFWGNIWAWIDGLNVYIDPDTRKTDAYWAAEDFADGTGGSPYKNVGYSLESYSNGAYVSAFGWSQECDFLFLPTEVLGNSALPVGDAFYNTQTGWRVARLGGYWVSGLPAGAFCWNVDAFSGGRFRHLGGGAVYVPPNN